MSKGKRLLTILLVIFCISALLAFVSCQKDDDNSVDSSSQSSSEIDGDSSSSGDSSSTGDSSSSSTVDPEPIDAVLIDEIPQSAIKTIATAGDKTAKASWVVEYTQDGIKFVAYVEDNTIFAEGDNMFANDGIELLISKVQRVKGYSDGAISVSVDVNGEITVKNLKTKATVVDSGVTAEADNFTLDNQTIAGYMLTVTVPYAQTEVTYENKDLAVVFGLTNANDAITLTSVYDKTFGADDQNVHTFVAVGENGTFSANPYVQFGMTWGTVNDVLVASSVWNIDGDDGTADATISSSSVDNKDNLIYMRNSNSLNYYMEAKFSVTALLNSEKWGKFGLTVTSEDGANGFFYYVDAAAAEGTAINENSIRLGYNNRAGVGAWAGNWQDIGAISGENVTSAAYQNNNYVTLGVYRQNGVFKLYVNGTYVKTVSCGIGHEEDAYVGIASFNITMSVKDYTITTDAEDLADKKIVQQSIDYLFIGDSYIDTAFWYTWKNTFGSLKAANEGVGGTQTAYWINMINTLQVKYSTKNVIMHIGVNDIDNGASVVDTANNIGKLFTMLSEAFPNVNIYYAGLAHNMMFPQYWGAYDQVNAAVSAVASTNEKLNFIDMNAIITANSEGNTYQWFAPDGLHYGLDGYAAFDKAICEAIGVEREVANYGMGSVTVDGAPAYSYSSGWKFEENGIIHNTGKYESQLYFSDIYAADFYAEVKISIAGTNYPDDLPKAGLAFRSQKGMWFWYIDLAKAANNNGTYYNNGWAQVVARPEVAKKDWQWPGCWSALNWIYNNQYPNEYPNGVSFDYNTDHSYITLAIAKVGKDAWFISDGKVVNVLNGIFETDEKVAASVVNFNMDMYVKDAVTITNATDLRAKLDSFKIYDRTKTIDGDMSDWTDDELANAHVIPATDGREIKVYATLADDGVYLFYDAIHNSYVSNLGDWWLNTNVEFRLDPDGKQRFASANGQGSFWTFAAAAVTDFKFVTVTENGKQHTRAEVFVSYAMIDGFDRDAASINAGFAWKTGGETGSLWDSGDFWYVAEADPGVRSIVITKKGIAKTNAALRTIDGDAADWADDTFIDFSTTGDFSAIGFGQYSAFLGNDGLYMFYKINASSLNVGTTFIGGDWWRNVNLEIMATANMAHSRLMVYGGKLYHTGWVTDAAMTYTHTDSGDTWYVEIFVENSKLIGVTADTQSVEILVGGQLHPFGWRQLVWVGENTPVTINKK